MSIPGSGRASLALALALALLATPLPSAAQDAAPPQGTAASAAPAPRDTLARRLGVMAPDARPFFEENLPAPLLRPGPRGLLWWQWVAIPVLVILALALGSVLGWLTRRILGHLAARTATEWDDILIEKISAPLTAFWAIAIVTALHSALLLDDAAIGVLQRILRAATYLVFFWAGFRSVDVGHAALSGSSWTRSNTGLAGLLPLGRKIAKLLLLAIGLVAVLNELGFQVASLLAGLGIGGIALALAAQKTVENLFGSVAIGVDQPFRVGDFVKVGDFTGTVETIGMRSTRFRTLERTLVTIPNGKLADMQTETFAARDRIRLYAVLNLSHGTRAAAMRAVLAGIDAALAGHPKLWTGDAPSVRFIGIADSSLQVEVNAWFATKDWGEFTRIRQDLLLAFLEIVERAGTALAFPTRTVHLASQPPTSPAPGGKG